MKQKTNKLKPVERPNVRGLILTQRDYEFIVYLLDNRESVKGLIDAYNTGRIPRLAKQMH